MAITLYIVNIIGVYLLAAKVFRRQVGLLSALIFSVSRWSQSLFSSGEIRIFLSTAFLTYGLWLVLKKRPRLAVVFLGLASLIMFLTLYPDLQFWLRHGIIFGPSLVPLIHEHIDSCHRLFPIPFCRLFDNKLSFIGRSYLFNYYSHFSPDSLFMGPEKNSIFFAPFFYLGLFSVFYYWQKYFYLVVWVCLYPLAASLSGGFNYFHSSLGMVLLPVLIAYGFFQIIKIVVVKR
jgi:hypothetical protein